VKLHGVRKPGPPTAVGIVRLEREGARVRITLRLTSDIDSPNAEWSRECMDVDDAVTVFRSFLDRFVAASQRP
jgi:hypothetical protein